MRRAIATVAGLLAVMAAAPAVAQADIYNPTTAQYIPTSYYYPPPAPSYDPPPMYFPPVSLDLATTPTRPGAGGGRPKPTRAQRILGYRRSPQVSRAANRQLAALFAKRLGKGDFARARFVREADKGTFRKAFKQLVKPLGWSDTDYADALAAYAISSYMVVNGVTELTGRERIGAQTVRDALRKRLLANRRMRRVSDRGKQLATERLNTVTVVQLVQFATGDAARRAAQVEATRTAGMKTFRGDLARVQLGRDGFEPRAGG